MATYTYPIVFILNRETGLYNGYLPDLAIAAEGKTLEETIARAQDKLKHFFELAIKFENEVPTPSPLDQIINKWKGYKVMVVTAAVK
jgi:predicted RNase H-like HicB family nuclease